MLKYQTICEANKIQERLKRNAYGNRWQDTNYTRDADTLALFTLGTEAQRDSQANFDLIMSTARRYDQDLVILKPQQVQVAGFGDGSRSQDVARVLFPDPWLREYERWVDTSYPINIKSDTSEQGAVSEFYTFRPTMCLREQQGVYDVTTGQRLTNRREIIERMWRLGFATQRGRPPSIARIRWTGNREDLELITDLAERHWSRRKTSEVSKKLVSAWRSINRYAAWPGSW